MKHKHNWKRTGIWFYLGWRWTGKECLLCHCKRMLKQEQQ